MLSTHSLELTDTEYRRLGKVFTSEDLINFDTVCQPIFSGHLVTLSDLLTMEDTNQEPVVLSKVKSILFKSETGLANTKCLLNPIIVASTIEDGTHYIVSGRHRTVALDLICKQLGFPSENVRVKVTNMVFQNMEQLCMSCVIYNTNRTMNRTERDDLVLTSKSGSLALFDRVSNVTTLKKSFGIELADTMLQNLPDTKILRNSFNVLFTRYLGTLTVLVPQVHKALLSQDRKYFDKGMEFVYTVVERATKEGVFEWDGRINFQREVSTKILDKLTSITKELSEAGEGTTTVENTPKKRTTKKAKEVKQSDEPSPNNPTDTKTDVARPELEVFPTVRATESFEEW